MLPSDKSESNSRDTGHASEAEAVQGAHLREHVPVMAREVIEYLDIKPGDTVVDGTFGAGGHARLIAAELQRDSNPNSLYIGVDRDISATDRFARFNAEVEPLRTRFIRADFPSAFEQLIDEGVSASVVMLDVGVSSMQLDQTERGFAYSHDAPLDMRMDQSAGESAADVLAHAEEREITRILREYGEERFAKRIARTIVRRREQGEPIQRTSELVEAIRASIPGGGRKSAGGHPAKRTFQALRVHVNDELGMLKKGLESAFELLEPNGRLLVLSFQSLEDRIVKRQFEEWAGRCTCPPGLPICRCGWQAKIEKLTRGVVRPSEAEVTENPRAASTKLRAVRKLPTIGEAA